MEGYNESAGTIGDQKQEDSIMGNDQINIDEHVDPTDQSYMASKQTELLQTSDINSKEQMIGGRQATVKQGHH